MAKQFIIAAMEEVFGEYILNISKDNLKIAALRGKIKLENVQLDGDLIGSQVLGAVGLSGFGVLSCSAKSIKVSVPWKNLEKEPTRFEVKGVHLVCVPLIPSTANKMYGAGTKVDPRCSLRTRAKRLVLARLERNYWNGQIPGEGPPMKRISRAVKEVERDWLKRTRNFRKSPTAQSKKARADEEMEQVIDSLVNDLADADSLLNDSDDKPLDISFSVDDLPQLPRDWKVKLREKILRNMEASMHDFHIRCEVPESDSDINAPEGPRQKQSTSASATGPSSPYERAFALGFTLESFVVRTANEQWEVGSHDNRNPVDGSAMSSAKGHLGPNEYVVKNNKIGCFRNISFYWDNNPPFLLAETDLLRGNYRKATSEKLLSRVSAAMDAMFSHQDPGKAVRKSMSVAAPRDMDEEMPHQYVCKNFNSEIRSRSSDRTQPGPISLSADVLPFNMTFEIRPYQFIQYQKLRADIKSQQRADTMLRQRPTVGPKEDPRAWWKYSIACVTSRPNSRPWEDVLRIGRCRRRYVELVAKKIAKKIASDSTGFHPGLSDAESAELLELEDLLPIEALLAFHLLALRRVYKSQVAKSGTDHRKATPVRGRSKGPFRMLRSRSSSASRQKHTPTDASDEGTSGTFGTPNRSSTNDSIDSTTAKSLSLLDAMTLRLGRKSWFMDWRLHDAAVTVILRRSHDNIPVALLDLRALGSARAFGRGKHDYFFDVIRCDLHHFNEKVLFINPRNENGFNEDPKSPRETSNSPFPWTPSCRVRTDDPALDLTTPSGFLDLPPAGTICRVAAGRNNDTFKLSISAHPVTLVWTASLFDGLSEFIAQPTSETRADITEDIKNAATPLARKAQLAFLSPASSSLHMNIAAPKIWIPIISRDTESVLFVDAGTIKLSTLKEEGQIDSDWEMRAEDIQVNFVRNSTSSRLYSDVMHREPVRGAGTSVIRPFSVQARNKFRHENVPDRKGMLVSSGPVRRKEVLISPICFSLVDAEALARSFGNWYARVIRRFAASDRKSQSQGVGSRVQRSRQKEDMIIEAIRRADVPDFVSVKIEKIEVAIEGHSKHVNSSDEKSLTSLDSNSLLTASPATRTYLVEVIRILLKHSQVEQVETTNLSVADASIIRLREGALYEPLSSRRESVESENCILVCNGDSADHSFLNTYDRDRVVLRASLLRDRAAHLDEVELDINSVILRVSPTTLKDCAKSFRRIVEVVQIMTREMERKVHEAGREARRRDRFGTETGFGRPESPSSLLFDRPISPAKSDAMTDIDPKSPKAHSDSSILFKVTLKESTMLAGRPTYAVQKVGSTADRRLQYAIIQILSSARIMFQSIENPDGTGSKTLHVSVDNVSSLVNTDFERVAPSHAPPMIGPFGAEFRIMYNTENLGCVVSQDVSLDCETVKAHLTPNDLSIMINITRRMLERLRAFGVKGPGSYDDSQQRIARSRSPLSSLIRYQKRGTGIATRVRAEVHAFSFVLLRAFKSHSGAPEFLDFNVEHVKLRLEGCMSALSGEFSARMSVNSFNSEVNDWDYAVEPFPFNVSIEQMPNELSFNVSTASLIQVNVTGVMLRDLAEMKFDILQDRSGFDRDEISILSPSALSTVGLRRATEARTISVKNTTGFDLHVHLDSGSFSPDSGLVTSGSEVLLSGISPVTGGDGGQTLCLRLSAATKALVGEREPVFDLPIKGASNRQASLHLLRPVATTSPIPDIRSVSEGRASPETVFTELAPDIAYYSAEPVVEWCMHNQRLRPNVVDVFSLPKGRDLLSSGIWSPEDDVDQDLVEPSAYQAQDNGAEAATGTPRSDTASPDRSKKVLAGKRNWIWPYLKNDSPEWTDMTCTLRMARDRVMLPDNNWIWVNDWTVDLSGTYGEETDADGWEYQADFESFTRIPRYYKRGDACRRRRWTRTRMVRPPRLNDPLRQLKFVWETAKDGTGNCSIYIRSPLCVRNKSMTPLSVFLYSPSWSDDEPAGSLPAGGEINVPIMLASAVYMRLAKPIGDMDPNKLENCVHTDRIMILPTSQTSSNYVRTCMDLKDVSGTVLHFLVEVRSDRGIVDLIIEPIFRLVNLLPCDIQCRVGQLVHNKEPFPRFGNKKNDSKALAHTETFTIASGKEGCSTAFSPWLKPHISLRVPGYQWSQWQRIMNRKGNSNTWRPLENEEHLHFSSNGDSAFAEELTSVVHFERLGKGGDTLTLLLSVECGHSPTLRVYSQYWIVDISGFGCRFSEGFMDLLGLTPDGETSRRSYLLPEERKDPKIRKDMAIPGHQWSIGMSGMSMYFSKREKLTLAIEASSGEERMRGSEKIKSKWISPLDISNVMPKTVFSVDDKKGPRQFELALNVTVCPGAFARTKMITLFPRYQIINLLHRELVIAQDGCLARPTIIPSQSTIPLHWEKGSLAPKVRLGAPTVEERGKGKYEKCWSNGCLQLDRVGITSMRLPTSNRLASIPMVIQAEVRLATKEQPSAVSVVIWSANDKSNPLYMLRNRTRYTILCRQPINEDHRDDREISSKDSSFGNCPPGVHLDANFECGTDIGPSIRAFLGLSRIEEFVWVLKSSDGACFGFDNPEKPHVLEWTCVSGERTAFDSKRAKAFVEVDAMGSSSILTLPGNRRVCCMIKAEHSTKVIEFVEDHSLFEQSFSHTAVGDEILRSFSHPKKGFYFEEELDAVPGKELQQNVVAGEEDEDVAFCLRVDIPSLLISVVDNADPLVQGREILLARAEKVYLAFSQTREGYHELETRLMTFQVDNHVRKSIHPILVFCPQVDSKEPFLHMSAVRRLQSHSNTFVFRYAAIRVLEIEIYLDRRTAEKIALFIEPLTLLREDKNNDQSDWVSRLAESLQQEALHPDHRAPKDIGKLIHLANSGRIYFEQLHLHPVRIGLTFTQEWMDELSVGGESMMIFQFIRGMASIANAPLVFTSFVVDHVFEAPQALMRVIVTHYSSQLTKQILGILGSLAILGAPADFISHVGTGVRDFFYEPIQGAVLGPRQFIEGLEAGTQSLARGVFVGVVRGAANVTEVVNANLAGLTADDEFIDERRAHQRMLTDSMSRGAASTRSFGDSLYLAGASLSRSVRSGALGIVEQPSMYASKHGPVGFVKGVGKAIVGAVVKPVVGVGDAAVLVMNHMSDATSKQRVIPKIPIRIRRALPSRSMDKLNCVRLEPFDERAARAQQIVTGGETSDDAYIGHIDTPNHLIIASEQCLWAIDRRSREPWCVNWEEISHFRGMEGGVRIVVFSQTGLKTFIFQTENTSQSRELNKVLSMQARKMANSSENSSRLTTEPDSLSRRQIPGIKARQVNHVFGSFNKKRKPLTDSIKDEADLVEQCYARVNRMTSDSQLFFKALDEEAWSLVSFWGQVFSGLSSKRCIVASIINGTGGPLQIKSTKLLEGGSPCYTIPTAEYDAEQGVLRAGGVIIFFAWGVGPSLLQAGNVFMHIETNGFLCELADHQSRATFAKALPGYQVGFLEKSYDESSWWAKYWIMVRGDK